MSETSLGDIGETALGCSFQRAGDVSFVAWPSEMMTSVKSLDGHDGRVADGARPCRRLCGNQPLQVSLFSAR